MAVADALCDRVAFLVDGRIAACDAPAALKRKYGKPAVVVEREPEGGIDGRMGSPPREGPEPARLAEYPLDGLADNPGFLAELRGPGVVGIRTLDASLDRIFRELTGKDLS